MRRSFFAILIIVFVTSIFTSCDNYSRVLKSDDLKYKQAKADEYFENGAYGKSQILYEELISVLKGTQNLEKAYLRYCYSHFNQKNYISSAYYFKNYYFNFPNSDKSEEALYMTAYSHYKQSPKYRLDQQPTQKAIDGFQLFVNTFPESTRVKECNNNIKELRRKLEVKAYEGAKLYYHMENYKAAVVAFGNILKDYPDTKDEESIHLHLIRSNYEYAKKSIESKQEERYREVLNKYYTFIDKFPESKSRKEAENIFDNTRTKLKKYTSL